MQADQTGRKCAINVYVYEFLNLLNAHTALHPVSIHAAIQKQILEQI